jgi:hypothetical protein
MQMNLNARMDIMHAASLFICCGNNDKKIGAEGLLNLLYNAVYKRVL